MRNSPRERERGRERKINIDSTSRSRGLIPSNNLRTSKYIGKGFAILAPRILRGPARGKRAEKLK